MIIHYGWKHETETLIPNLTVYFIPNFVNQRQPVGVRLWEPSPNVDTEFYCVYKILCSTVSCLCVYAYFSHMFFKSRVHIPGSGDPTTIEISGKYAPGCQGLHRSDQFACASSSCCSLNTSAMNILSLS